MQPLLIFDCDGVLVQSEPGETLCLLQVARRYGYDRTLSDVEKRFRGRKMAQVAGMISEEMGKPLPDSFVPEVRELCANTIDKSMVETPGLSIALDGLQNRRCVASNSPLELIKSRLRSAGLSAHFGEQIYSAYEVGSWKPDPTLFQFAASRNRFPNDQCIVIEDSAIGVEAALSAGMNVVLYGAETKTVPESAKVRHLLDMSKLPDLIASF